MLKGYSLRPNCAIQETSIEVHKFSNYVLECWGDHVYANNFFHIGEGSENRPFRI